MAKDDLDCIIDSAVRELGAGEPPEGFEHRILQRIRLEESCRRRFAVRLWALAACGAFAIIFAPWMSRSSSPRPRSVAATNRPAMSLPASPKSVRHQHATRHNSPRRLSVEERALLAFASRYPEQAMAALADLQRSQSAPLEIDALSIPPLQIESLYEDNQQ